RRRRAMPLFAPGYSRGHYDPALNPGSTQWIGLPTAECQEESDFPGYSTSDSAGPTLSPRVVSRSFFACVSRPWLLSHQNSQTNHISRFLCSRPYTPTANKNYHSTSTSCPFCRRRPGG